MPQGLRLTITVALETDAEVHRHCLSFERLGSSPSSARYQLWTTKKKRKKKIETLNVLPVAAERRFGKHLFGKEI